MADHEDGRRDAVTVRLEATTTAGEVKATELVTFSRPGVVSTGLPQDWGCKGQVSVLRLFSDQGWMRGLDVEAGKDRG